MSTPSHSRPEASSPGSVPSKRRRVRVTRACDNCKTRKRRCNGEIPCDLCMSQDLACTYDATYSRGRVPDLKPARFSEKETAGEAGAPTTQTSRVASPAGDPAGHYLGPTSPFSFLRRACRRFVRGNAETNPGHDFFEQAPVCTAGDRRMPIIEHAALVLPSREVSTALLDRYFNFATPTYRFVHEPTTKRWVNQFHTQFGQVGLVPPLKPIQEAIVLLVLSTACVYDSDHETQIDTGDTNGSPTLCEIYFQAAQNRITTEAGRPCLESVQARLLTCLLLLNTSRINQAWYTFGTTIQMIYALGLHRARRATTLPTDHIVLECQKRCFYAAYQLDAYLSIILGRPPMLSDQDVDQRFPEAVHDEDLFVEEIRKSGRSGDCPMTAAILHQKLAKIAKKASRLQNDVQPIQDQRLLEVVRELNQDIDQWRVELPVILSGAVHASSLVVVFRRQVTVLQVAASHATLLVNRPLLLSSLASTDEAQGFLVKGISAAKRAIEVIKDIMEENSMFPANWNFQYVAFHALSVIYVYIIQCQRGRLPTLSAQLEPEALFAISQTVQHHLAQVTRSNAPGLRYSIILEELEQETRHMLRKGDEEAGLAVSSKPCQTHSGPGQNAEFDMTWDALSTEFPLDPDLWSQMNSFPFNGEI